MAIAQLLHTNLLKVAVLFVEEPRPNMEVEEEPRQLGSAS